MTERDLTLQEMRDYLDGFYRCPWEDLAMMRQAAEEELFPIIRRQTEMFLGTFLAAFRPERILEIGTAFGYSAIFFARSCPEAQIVTIEKDEFAAAAAAGYFRTFGVSDRVRLIEADGLAGLTTIGEEGGAPFDLVFIDASKGHYKAFLDAALPLCRPGAVLLSDDIFQRGNTVTDGIDHRRKHHSAKKHMREFLAYITEHEKLTTTLLDVGDGLAFSVYKG